MRPKIEGSQDHKLTPAPVGDITQNLLDLIGKDFLPDETDKVVKLRTSDHVNLRVVYPPPS